jgi:formylglycine-generating enzyme required for sulfatase activity
MDENVNGAGRKARVLRGGSWNNNRNNARCAYRNRNIPDNFNNNAGFRLVRSHDFCSSQ